MDQPSRKLEKKFNELSNRTYKAVTDVTKCISCGTCIKFYPLYIRKFNENKKAITIKRRAIVEDVPFASIDVQDMLFT